jgi:hypothetical protein
VRDKHRSGYHRLSTRLSVAFCYVGAGGVQFVEHSSHNGGLNGVAKCCHPPALGRNESHALKNACPRALVPWTG